MGAEQNINFGTRLEQRGEDNKKKNCAITLWKEVVLILSSLEKQ